MLVLLVSEMGNNHPVEHVWYRLAAILLTTFMVPMLAAFQTVVVTRKLKSDDCDPDKVPSMLKRLTACHSAVWLIASLAIVYSFQWQKIVRGNWGLDHWLLLDEVLIIAPVVLSLIASWAIFFDIQTVFAPSSILKSLNKRFKFVALRIRVYLAIFLVPTLLAIGVKDFIDGQFASSNAVLMAGLLVGLPLMLVAFPFLVMFIWQTRSIDDPELLTNVQTIADEHRLKVARIRIWSTSRQIVNAVVAGVFPYCRVILLSDGLVSQFSRSQLAAIVRHEAGHIRRLHLPLRMFFILLPLAIVMSAELMGLSAVRTLEQMALRVQLTTQWVMPFLIACYCIYLFVVLVWLSHQMEYDADQYAVTRFDPESKDSEICDQGVEDMEEALLRFAELMPSQVDRKSLWHPTLRKRLIRLAKIKNDPSLLRRHAEDFTYRQFLLFCGILTFATLFFAVFAAN